MIPFGGEHVPRGVLMTLQKLLGAATVFPYREINGFYHSTISAATTSFTETENSKLYWYKLYHADGSIRGYINIVPGEFSITEPTGNVIIKDYEKHIGPSFTQELAECVSYIEHTYTDGLGKETGSLLIKLKALLASEGKGQKEYLLNFARMIREMAAGQSAEQIHSRARKVMDDFFADYSTNLVEFSACFLLLQLQLELSGFVPEDFVYENPRQGLVDVIDLFNQKGMLDKTKVAGLANFYYSGASEAVSLSVATASIEKATAHLRMATHLFYCCAILTKTLVDLNITIPMDFTADIADEGWASSLAGMFALSFMTERLGEYPLLIKQEILSGAKNIDFSFINRHSHPTKPYFPRKTAQVILAAGKVSAGKNIQQAIGDLEELDSQYKGADTFENSGKLPRSFDLWFVEMNLGLAYGKMGNKEMQQLYMVRASSKMIIEL